MIFFLLHLFSRKKMLVKTFKSSTVEQINNFSELHLHCCVCCRALLSALCVLFSHAKQKSSQLKAGRGRREHRGNEPIQPKPLTVVKYFVRLQL
jgi:hypothetical protein